MGDVCPGSHPTTLIAVSSWQPEKLSPSQTMRFVQPPIGL
jgi:hypothetical protein